jgi:TatD DNase family protein
VHQYDLWIVLTVLIDTHAHLDYPDFAADFPAVLVRARQAGVDRIISIGTSVESSVRAVALAQDDPMIYAAVGVHPTHAGEASAAAVAGLRAVVAGSWRVAAIGETGLDYHRLPEGGESVVREYKETQMALFRQQLDLAADLQLNAIIHQRDAWEDTLNILDAYRGQVRGVFHCFGGTLEEAVEVIAMGHLVSFTGIVTFKNGADIRETAAGIPAGSFMVETDCPYLAPVPFRGQRSEPAHTRETAAAVAAARGVSLEQIAAETTATAEKFFRL